jgi:hypothetical protein
MVSMRNKINFRALIESQIMSYTKFLDRKHRLSAVINRNETQVNEIFNSGNGANLLVIFAATAATAGLCYISPVGKTVSAAFMSAWDAVLNRFYAIIEALKSLFSPPAPPVPFPRRMPFPF